MKFSFEQNSNSGQNGFEYSSSDVEIPPEVLKSPDRLDVKDYLFDQYMKQQLIEDFFDELHEYLEEEEVGEMIEQLMDHSDEDVYSTLSLPKELRHKKFEYFKRAIEEEGENPADLMEDLTKVSQKYGFGIGYHTSPHDIRPDKNGEWKINGTENDHRDNDLNRAYYSSKFRHLFRKKNPEFI